MKYLLLLPLLFMLSACEDDDDFTGSGNVVTDDRTEGAFTRISVANVFNITITQGVAHRVTVRADDNLLDQINTTTSNGQLDISLANGSFDRATLEVDVVTPELNALVFTNAVSGELNNFVSTSLLDINLRDATKLTMSGSAPSVNLNLSQAAELSGLDFTAIDCSLALISAAEGNLTVTNALTGRIKGAASFGYRGSPTIDVEVDSGAEINDLN